MVDADFEPFLDAGIVDSYPLEILFWLPVSRWLDAKDSLKIKLNLLLFLGDRKRNTEVFYMYVQRTDGQTPVGQLAT